MKKKIINGLLFAVVLVAATSSFVSCKDYDGYNELNEKYLTLQDAFNKQVAAMNDYVLTSRYNAETGYSAAELAAKGTIKKRLDDLENDTASLAKRISDNNLAIKKAQALAEKDSAMLHKLVAAWGNDLDYAVGKAAEVLATVANDSAKWNETSATVSERAKYWNEAYDSIAKRSKEWNRAVEVADKAWAFVDNTTTKDGKKIEKLQDLVNAYEEADAALAEDIAALKQDVDNILALIQQQVTGIEIQATVNPIYGTFAYPAGIQSNILATYFGETEVPVFFPAGDGEDADYWVGSIPAITTAELEAIGVKAEQFGKDGILMNDTEGNAGKLYLTVNPSDVIMDGKEFTLRTSDNKVSKVVLSPLATTDEQLKWGYKRAGSANGFYVATATIKKDNVKDVALSFDMESLKPQVKAIMNDWSSASATDIAKLGLAVMNGMQANLPRLGVQAQWKDTLGWKNYVSKYDLAAFSAKPVGYDFLYNQDFSAPIVKLKNKITAKEKAIALEFANEIKAMINVTIGLPASSGSIVVDADNKIWLILDGSDGSAAQATTTVTIPVNGFAPGNPAAPITLSISNKVDITALYTAIKGGIETSINGMKDKVSPTVDKFLNKLINAQNKIFDKVASVVKNPNRYIQPALIARSEQFGYFYPSRTHFAPTQIKKGTKIMFYPTTLTGEVVAPAFKKYIAVSGAWEINDMSKTKDAKAFNTGDVMNKVIDGNIYNMSTPFEYTIDAPAGTVLEFIYETLGYNGKVAGKKYYIEVFE